MAQTATAFPTTLSFGSQTVGTTSASQAVSVTNNGAAALELNGVVVGPMTPTAAAVSYATDFPVSDNTCANVTVPPGGSCSFSVSFSPKNANGTIPFPTSRTANLRVYGWPVGVTPPANLTNFNLVSMTLTGTAAAGAPPLTSTAYSVTNISAALPDYRTRFHNFGPLNNAGQAAGNVYFDQPASCADGGNYIRAMLYESGAVQVLGTLPNARGSSPGCLAQTEAVAINAAGQVLGYSQDENGDRRPVLFSAGSVQTLDSLVTDGSGTTFAYPITMSPNGIIAAYRSDLGFVLLTNGTVTDMKLPMVDTFAVPIALTKIGFAGEYLFRFRFAAVNDARQATVNLAVGPCNVYANCPGFQDRAALWQNGSLTSFPATPNAGFGALNNSGQSVGMISYAVGQPMRVALWENGVITDLSGLPCLSPSGFNLTGQVVGARNRPDQNGFCNIYDRVISLWTRNGGMTDLSVPGWTFVQHAGSPQINDAGQILTEAYVSVTDSFDFVLLTPVVTVQGGTTTVESGQTTLVFSNVTSPGTVTISPIDPATIASVPDGSAVVGALAYEISTTASFSGPVTIGFVVPGNISESEFNAMAVLHLKNGTLLNVTTSRNYAQRTIYATTTSFSPFYVVRQGIRVNANLTPSQHKAGSTVPVKVQLLNAASVNISSAALPLTVRGLKRIGSNAALQTAEDSGKSGRDGGFRYDPSLAGYIFNLNTKGLEPGKYVLSFFAGSDRNAFYTVALELK